MSLLIESPQVVDDYLKQTPVKKKSSFFRIGKDIEEKLIPAIDWGRIRAPSSIKPQRPSNPFKNMFEKAIESFRSDDSQSNLVAEEFKLSETFTAHIGTQQIRTMYNMQLCQKLVSELFQSHSDQSQTYAMSLYSKSLNGLLLLVRRDDLPLYGKQSTSNSGTAIK